MAAFLTRRRLGLGECDRSGFAYFPSYVGMLASVVEEMFGSIGLPYSVLMGKHAIGVPTVRLEVTFVKPGFLDDGLDWQLAVTRIGTTSAELQHIVTSRGETLWMAHQVLVAVSLETHRPVALTSEMRTGFARFTESGNAQCPAA